MMRRFRQLLAREPIARDSVQSDGPTLRRALGWPALTLAYLFYGFHRSLLRAEPKP